MLEAQEVREKSFWSFLRGLETRSLRNLWKLMLQECHSKADWQLLRGTARSSQQQPQGTNSRRSQDGGKQSNLGGPEELVCVCDLLVCADPYRKLVCALFMSYFSPK